MRGESIYVIAVFLMAIFLVPYGTLAAGPVIGFALAREVMVGDVVQFDASPTLATHDHELFFEWKYADAIISTSSTASQVFDQKGTHMVDLSVGDGTATSSAQYMVTVQLDQGTSQVIPTTVRLSEILPNPSGSDDAEWIELYNYGSSAVDLSGWKVIDASDRAYVFSEDDFGSVAINPNSYFLLPRSISGIALNNTDESLKLITAQGAEIDFVSYDSSKENYSYSRKQSNQWQWTDVLTPGDQNEFSVSENTQTTDEEENTQQNDEADAKQDTEAIATSSTVPVGTIQFSALFPAPDGSDEDFEYIEITNTSSTTFDIAGWKIADEQSEYELVGKILENETLRITRPDSGIALNNTGDTVYLYDHTGKLHDSVVYDKAVADELYVRVDEDTWQWEHEFETNTEDSEQSSDEVVQDDLGEMAFSIGDVLAQEDGALITVQGVVTAAPGEIGEQIIYIEDQHAGIQVYLHSALWPQLQKGTIVEVTGELRTAYGERRIGLAESHDVVIVTSGNAIAPRGVACLAPALVGTSVAVEVKYIKKDGTYRLFTSDTCDELFVRDHDLLSDITSDDILALTGIVRQRNEKIFLALQDIEAKESEQAVIATTQNIATTDPQNYSIGSTQDRNFMSLPWTIAYVSVASSITLSSIVLTIHKRQQYNS